MIFMHLRGKIRCFSIQLLFYLLIEGAFKIREYECMNEMFLFTAMTHREISNFLRTFDYTAVAAKT